MVDAPLEPALRLIVLDAIYFKGDWLAPFNKNRTRDLPFTLAGGQSITHPRMSRSGRFSYEEEDNFQAVALPYAGGDVSMYVFLPKGSLSDLLRSLTPERFDRAAARMESRHGTVELPRFKLENEYNLKGVLAAMGMRLAFTSGADLSGISSEPLKISWVKQKTYLEVNEQGTVAAAATGIGVTAEAAHREPPPFRMVVDRPFFLAIREQQTGLLLFLGAIADPR
jgi:serpin B